MSDTVQNGKGDAPRSCFSQAYRDNYDAIFRKPRRELKDGEPCDHPGCAHHVSHPCEKCGKIGATGEYQPTDIRL